eukprot:TRINITY_DN2112_c0_g1_i1.p1 TRINITY_DN2112_c0_g1~~TRINITY_DN2112_c0_g1_i1.p1  ORF type:complete len:1195 (-),score=400.65 TRINITY_DN2112_c0_g1_i1:94-3678(-)
MAGRDLAKELEKESFKLDSSSEKKVLDAVMALIRDSNNLVQEQAIKCIGPLLRKVEQGLVEKAVLSLSDDLIDPKNEENRDTASIALKSIIADMNPGSPVIKDVLIAKQTPKLLAAVKTIDNQNVKMAALEILSELLRRYGRLMNAQHKELLETCLKYLTTTQKRAINCLAFLVSVVPENTFLAFMKEFIKHFSEDSKDDHAKTYIMCFGVLSQSVGHRVGRFLETIMPLIEKHCGGKTKDCDLRDSCFTAFTAVAVNCPKEVTPFLGSMLELCMTYAKWDPLFDEMDGDVNMEEEGEDAGDEAEAEEEEEEEEEEDDAAIDDMAYKVRKGAIRAMAAIFTAHPEMLVKYAESALKGLIARVSEPVEDVRLDVLSTCTAMLKAKSALVVPADAEKVTAQLKGLISQIVSGITRILKRKKSVKPKPLAVALLTELITALPGSFGDNVGTVLPAVTDALSDAKASFTLKIGALTFLRLLFTSHTPEKIQAHVAAIFPHMIKTIADPFNRISAEALQLAVAFVYVIRPANSTFDFKPYVEQLYAAALKQAQAPSADQEVKEYAIECLGVMLAVVGDALKQQADCIKLIVNHLSREHARAAVVKVLPIILRSNLKLDLSPFLNEILQELSSFLKKNDRPLQEASLVALNEVVIVYGNAKAMPPMVPVVVGELASFVTSRSTDLYLVHLAFTVCYTIVQQQGATAVSAAQEKLLPQTYKLIHTAVVQGVALESLMRLYGELVVVNAKGLGYSQLLEQLLAITKGCTNKQVLHLVGECVGVVCTKCPPKAAASVVDQFVKEAKSAGGDAARQQTALICLGNIGSHADLSSYELHLMLFSLFESGSPDVKQAAAFALGNVALGNMNKNLPLILGQMQSAGKQIQRLLLVSLRECMTQAKGDTIAPHVDTIMKLLVSHCDSEDIPTRDNVSECVGKLIQISPEVIVPRVVEAFSSRSSSKRGTMVAAVKYALADNLPAVDVALAPHVAGVFEQLKFASEDKAKTLFVRERALLALKSLAAQKPLLIRDVVTQYLPLVFAETIPKQEYITIVELGLIKVTVDDALNARKDAFEILSFFLKNLFDRIDVPTFVRHIAPGIVDVYDIRLAVHAMLLHIANVAPAPLLEASDLLIPNLLLCGKLEAAGKRPEEADRNEEMQQSTFNVIYVLSKCPNAESFPKLQELIELLSKDKDVGEKFKKASKE